MTLKFHGHVIETNPIICPYCNHEYEGRRDIGYTRALFCLFCKGILKIQLNLKADVVVTEPKCIKEGAEHNWSEWLFPPVVEYNMKRARYCLDCFKSDCEPFDDAQEEEKAKRAFKNQINRNKDHADREEDAPK